MGKAGNDVLLYGLLRESVNALLHVERCVQNIFAGEH